MAFSFGGGNTGGGSGFSFGGGGQQSAGFSFGQSTTSAPSTATTQSGIFSFSQAGNTTAQPQQQAGSGFSFGGTASKPTTGFSFASPATTTQQQSSSGFSFSGSGGFGAQPTGGSSLFGSTKAPTTTVDQAKATPTFGSGLGGALSGGSKPFGNPGFQFSKSQTDGDSGGLKLGAASTSQTTAQPASLGGFNFATPKAGFGSVVAANTSTQPTAGGLGSFGGTPAKSTLGGGGFNFGGAPTPAATTQSTGGFTMGGATATAPQSTTGFSLGATTSATAQPSSGGFSFGAKPSQTQAANSGFSLSASAATTTKPSGFALGGASTATSSQPVSTGFSLSGSAGNTQSTTGLSLGGSAATTFGFGAKLGGATTATAATPTPAAGGFNLGSKTTSVAGGLGGGATATVSATTSGFKLGVTPLISSAATAASTATVAPKPTTTGTATLSKGLTFPTIGAATTSAATTAAVTAVTSSAPTLRYSDLENKVNSWMSELEQQEKLFLTQATHVNAWNKLLIDNADKITDLNSEFETVELGQKRLNEELDYIKTQQSELEDLLKPLEENVRQQMSALSSSVHTHHADIERERTYNLAESIDSQLKNMVQDLREVVEHVNSTSAPADGNNPVVQIGKILSAHVDSLQWLDGNSATLQQKVQEMTKQVDQMKKEQETKFRLAFN